MIYYGSRTCFFYIKNLHLQKKTEKNPLLGLIESNLKRYITNENVQWKSRTDCSTDHTDLHHEDCAMYWINYQCSFSHHSGFRVSI